MGRCGCGLPKLGRGDEGEPGGWPLYLPLPIGEVPSRQGSQLWRLNQGPSGRQGAKAKGACACVRCLASWLSFATLAHKWQVVPPTSTLLLHSPLELEEHAQHSKHKRIKHKALKTNAQEARIERQAPNSADRNRNSRRCNVHHMPHVCQKEIFEKSSILDRREENARDVHVQP